MMYLQDAQQGGKEVRKSGDQPLSSGEKHCTGPPRHCIDIGQRSSLTSRCDCQDERFQCKF